MLVCESTPITETLTDYFEHRATYQSTVDKLRELGASPDIIRALPQGTLDIGQEENSQ